MHRPKNNIKPFLLQISRYWIKVHIRESVINQACWLIKDNL